MTKTHHSLIEFDGKWYCANCHLPESFATGECGLKPISAYEHAKARKAESKEAMDKMQGDMLDFLDRLFGGI